VSRFTVAARALSQCARTSNLAKWSEVIMTTATDELRDDELDGVSGGLVVIAILAILIAALLPPPPTPLPKPS
jgi:hypothetical protein